MWGEGVNGKREDTGRDNGQRGVGQPLRESGGVGGERVLDGGCALIIHNGSAEPGL